LPRKGNIHSIISERNKTAKNTRNETKIILLRLLRKNSPENIIPVTVMIIIQARVISLISIFPSFQGFSRDFKE
jgi:hypothetical protein